MRYHFQAQPLKLVLQGMFGRRHMWLVRIIGKPSQLSACSFDRWSSTCHEVRGTPSSKASGAWLSACLKPGRDDNAVKVHFAWIDRYHGSGLSVQGVFKAVGSRADHASACSRVTANHRCDQGPIGEFASHALSRKRRHILHVVLETIGPSKDFATADCPSEYSRRSS